jgi:hypothetical protein
MSTAEFPPPPPPPPSSPSFYTFNSNTAIDYPAPRSTRKSFLQDVLPHFTRRILRSLTEIILPFILLPFHFFLLVLSVCTTVLAIAFLMLRTVGAYVDVAVVTGGQVWDGLRGGRSRRRRRDQVLRRLVSEEIEKEGMKTPVRGDRTSGVSN